MSKPEELVAEIKFLYGRRHEEKLQIQQDMVELRDEHGWKQPRIASETLIPQQTVSMWLRAYDEEIASGSTKVSRLTPREFQANSDRSVAKRVITESPSFVAEAFKEAPVEVQQQIAEGLAESPTVRLAAYRRDSELRDHLQPNRVQAGEELTLQRFASSLHAAFYNLREAHDLLGKIDRTDEEDPNIISELERIKMLLEVVDEAYRTGKSVDTWANELWEEAGR